MYFQVQKQNIKVIKVNHNMKILLVHNRYTESSVSGENIVYDQELAELKKVLGNDNIFSYQVSNDGANKIKLIFSIFYSIKHYRNIRNIIKKNNINIVHVHNFFPILTPSVFRAAKKGGAKVIHTLHNYRLWCISGILYRDDIGICEKCVTSRFAFAGILNKCYRKSITQSFLAQSSFWFYNFTKVFSNIDYFFVLTNFQKEKVISLGIDRKKVILKPNSIELYDLNSVFKNGYIFVGRLEKSKGIIELLDTWTKLDSNYVLTIIGTGELEEHLKKKYKQPNIIFKGKCSREETLKNISQSKYLIQASIWYETFGLTILEAMSLGVPVIGFNIGTRSDFIENEVNGFLTEINNLKQTIEKSNNYKEYDTLSKKAVFTAKQFQNNLITKQQINIYNRILNDQ